MIKFKYYFILLIQLPLSIPVVLVSTPFDNFRIECPQRHGVQRLNIRMAESQGYKRTDAVFSISCGNIQELSPWDTIPEKIAEMEYESCHYTEGFDPILEKHKNITCGTRKYLSGITRISGTKTSLMCCRLRTRDVSKCEEKEFEKPLGSDGFVEIQHEGMLINSINISDDMYLIKFCTFMPRAVGFIYDEVATSTPPPTTTTKKIQTTTTSQIRLDSLPSNRYSYESTFPTLLTQNELRVIDNRKNNQLLNINFETTQIINEQHDEGMRNGNDNVMSHEYIPPVVDFEEKNIYSDINNESKSKENHFGSVKPTKIDLIALNNDQYIKNVLSELPHEDVPNTSSTTTNNNNINYNTFHNQQQKLDIINNDSENEMNSTGREEINLSLDKSVIMANSKENTLINKEGQEILPIIDGTPQQPSFNTQYTNIQTSPIVIEEEIIGNNSDDLKTSKSSEKKELHSNSFENSGNILYSSGEKLPYPNPLPIDSSSTIPQSPSTIDTSSNDKIDIAKATVAKLHYSLKYNKKYNHSRSAFGSKIFKGPEDDIVKNEENQDGEIISVEVLSTTTSKYSTTQYIPRRYRKFKNDGTKKKLETSTKQPIKYETTTQIDFNTIKDDKNSKTPLNNNEIKHTYTSKELNEIEKNSNLMISKVDEFAQIPFDETFQPKDYHSSSENGNSNVKEPIQEAINEQYSLNGYQPNDSTSTKVTHHKPHITHRRLERPSPAIHYNGRNNNDNQEEGEEKMGNVNKGPLIDEDLDNSPFDDPLSESLLLSQQDIKSSNSRHDKEIQSPQGIDGDVFPRNYLTSHDIRRAPQKTYLENSYHPRNLNIDEKIQSTLPPLTVFKHEHKEISKVPQPLTIIKNDIGGIQKNENYDDTLTTTIINSEFLVKDNNLNSQRGVDNNLYIPLTSERPRMLSTMMDVSTTTIPKSTTTYNASLFYKVPKIKIPRKKERYLTFCTKEDAVRDENNLVIACGGDYDVWIPPRCPQGSSCFLTNDSTYRICCPVSSG